MVHQCREIYHTLILPPTLHMVHYNLHVFWFLGYIDVGKYTLHWKITIFLGKPIFGGYVSFWKAFSLHVCIIKVKQNASYINHIQSFFLDSSFSGASYLFEGVYAIHGSYEYRAAWRCTPDDSRSLPLPGAIARTAWRSERRCSTWSVNW